MTVPAAIVAYGVVLDLDLDDEPEETRPAWYDVDPLANTWVGLGEHVHSALLVAAGFTEPWSEVGLEWGTWFEAASRFLGLEVLNVPWYDEDRWVLAARYRVTDYDSGHAAFTSTGTVPADVDARFAWALEVLDFEEQQPSWHLLVAADSYWRVPEIAVANPAPPA